MESNPSTPTQAAPPAPAPVQSAPAPAEPAPHLPERRGAPRKAVDCPVQLRVVNPVDDQDGLPLAAVLMNLSASGVGLRLGAPLPPGREFVLALASAPAVVTPLKYRVVRCKPLGHGEFEVGAAFVRSPNPDPVQPPDASKPAAAPSPTTV